MTQRRLMKAEYQIVTPMFLGGANHEAGAIRGASIKGALAFWWRAYHFAGFVHSAGGDFAAALTEMRARECQLFGSSDGGQGAFLIKVDIEPTKALSTLSKGKIIGHTGEEIETATADIRRYPREAEGTVGVGARYFGYGLMAAFTSRSDSETEWTASNIKSYGGQLDRNAIAAKQSFSVEILFRPNTDNQDIQEIATALKLLGLLGGLGSRTRRGWGSLALSTLDGCDVDWTAPADKKEYETRLKKLFRDHPGRSLPGAAWPVTAFAQESGSWIADDTGTSGLDMLDKLGRAMLNYRGCREVGGQTVQAQFTEDHDWFRDGSTDVDIPYRSAFGLPHMYNSKQNNGVTPHGSERRASPMLCHVHLVGTTAIGVVTILPTLFLDQNIKAVRDRGANADKPYDLTAGYGAKRTVSGLDVLRGMVGAGPAALTANQVLAFSPVLP